MVRNNHLKESTLRALIAVGSRGRRKCTLSPDALKMVTALSNKLIQEALLRCMNCAKNSGRNLVTMDDFHKVLVQLTLDFSV